MSRIGYKQLSAAEKKAYEQFERAFNCCSSTVDSNGIDRNVDVMKVLQVALGDNPQVIYFNKTQIRISASLFGGKQVHFSGAVPSSQARTMQKQLETALTKAIEEIELLNPLSNYDKLICIYEYLQDNVTYDSKELEACCCLGRSVNPMSHNAYGVLVNKKGVCDGISSAFSLLAQRMGFECAMVSGKATFRTSGFSEHAWNVIKIADNFYHIDATWDVNHKEQTGEYSYEYFCVNDDSINKDHDWDIKTTPVCSREDISFYIRNRCYANNLSQLEEIFARYAKSKQKVVRAKIADGIAIPEPEEQYLGQKLVNVASSVGRYAAIKFIWNKNSRCFYAKFDS